jgi:riboflavin transporter FmnP
LTEAVFYLLNLYYFLTDYEMYEEHGLSLYMFINYVLNFNTIALLLYTILFTLTVFFACKWIVNPYKKGEEPTSDVPAEVIEEAAAEPSAKA